MTRIALYQSQTCIDPAANRQSVVDAIGMAAHGGAEMIFTPEMSNLLDSNRERAHASVYREEDDPLLATAREAAAALKIWVHLGSLALDAGDDSGRFVNRSFVIDKDGAIRGRYDKIHLFDVDLPTGESWRKSAAYRGGEMARVVRDTPVGTLGFTICYDLRFPALFSALAEAGADVITVPAAFTVPSGQAHWHVLLRARAVEAGLFIVAAAQGGAHEDGRKTYGHSLVVDPWGTVLLDAEDRNGVHFAEIDLARISEVRSQIPALSHRKEIGAVAD